MGTLLSVCALALSGSSGLAASMAKTVESPTAALTNFLKAAENLNFDQMIETGIDTRFDPDARKKMYTEQFSKSSEQIKKFAIVSKTEKTPSIYRFETTLSFKDGHQANIPFDVVNQDGNWKVLITPDSLSGTTELQNGTQIVPETEFSVEPNGNVHTEGYLASWNFTGLFGTMYSNATFSINNPNKQVLINLQQRNQYTEVAKIEYGVVQTHWYGDDVWGTTIVTGNYWESPVQAYIQGKSESYSDAKMRFVWKNSYYRDDGFGEVYD